MECMGLSGNAQGIEHGATVSVAHSDFPSFRFVVIFAGDGTPVGFAINPRPDYSELSRGEVLSRMYDAAKGRGPVLPGEPVTARLLRRLPLGQIQDFARDELVSHKTSPSRSMQKLAAGWAQAFEEVGRPGRRGRDDVAYAAVAAMYVAHGHDVHKVADELGYSVARIRNILYEARQPRRALLTSAPKGRSGGELTDKAKEILSRDS